MSRYQAGRILNAWGSEGLEESPDLGLTKVRVTFEDESAVFPDGTRLSMEQLRTVLKAERKCFLCDEGGLTEIRVFSRSTGWVRSLCPTDGAPTMLVSGIPMHRIKDTEPWADTRAKVRALGRVHGHVLDTATGLGYSAVMLAEKAESVVTIELDEGGLQIARLNPWSQGLFSCDRIEQVIGDAFEVVESFPASRFSAVFHDPPTIQLAGELYSLEFYKRLKRVLTAKGRLFHYVGDPDSGLGSKVTEGMIRRLHEAGFPKVERRPEAFGVTASAAPR